MLVHLTEIVLAGEGVGDAFLQLALVGTVIQEHGIRTVSVAPGTTRLLEIGFYTVRAVDVYHQSHVGLVNTHAEGVGGYHHPRPTFLPGLLSLILHAGVKTCVVEGGRNTGLVEQFRHFFRALTAACVNNGRARHAVQDMKELFALVCGIPHDVDEVLPLEAHLEDVETSGTSRTSFTSLTSLASLPSQLFLDILHDLRRSGRRERQHGGMGKKLADIRYLEIRRTEIISPLGDTVSLVDGDETDLHMTQFLLEEFGGQSLG